MCLQKKFCEQLENVYKLCDKKSLLKTVQNFFLATYVSLKFIKWPTQIGSVGHFDPHILKIATILHNVYKHCHDVTIWNEKLRK